MDAFSKEVDTDTNNHGLNLQCTNSAHNSPSSTSRIYSIPFNTSEDIPSIPLNTHYVKPDYLKKGQRETLSASAHSPVAGFADGVLEATRPSTSVASSYINPVWPSESLLCVSTTTSQNGTEPHSLNSTDAYHLEKLAPNESIDALNYISQPLATKNDRRNRRFEAVRLEPGMSATSSDAISEKAFSEVQRTSAECCWETNRADSGDPRKNGLNTSQTDQGYGQESASLESINSRFVLPPSADLTEIVFGDQEEAGNTLRTHAGPIAPTFSSSSRDQMLQKDTEDTEWLEVRIADALIDYEFDKNDVEKVFSQLAIVRKVLIQQHDKSMALVQVPRGEGARLITVLSDHILQDMRGRLIVRFAQPVGNDRISANDPEPFMNDSTLLDEDASAALLRLLCESTNLDYGEQNGIKATYTDHLHLSSPPPTTIPEGAIDDSKRNLTPLDLSFGHLFNSQDIHEGLTNRLLHEFSPAYPEVPDDAWSLNDQRFNPRETNLNNVPLSQKQSHYCPSARERPNSRLSNSGLRRGACTTYAAPPDHSNTDRLRLYLRQSQSAQIDCVRDNSPDFDGTGRLEATAMPNSCSWGDKSPSVSNGPYSTSSFTNAAADFPFGGGRRPYESPERPMMGGSDSRSCFDDRRTSFTTPLNDLSINNYYFDSPSSSEGKRQMWLSSHPQHGDYDERMFVPGLNPVSESFHDRQAGAGDLSGTSTKVRKWTARYDIQIPTDNSFQVTRRIIGTRGANMKRINQLTGAKLRLRGRGSGYLEGSSRLEADDPLHLCISCCDFAKYRAAKQMVDRLLRQIYVDYDAWSAEVYAVAPRLSLQVREVFLPNRDSGDGSGLTDGEPKEFGMPNNNGSTSRPPRRNDYLDDI